eukprot:scaffold14097_cov34-Phaeocystis_antarctica.AAC.1
MPQTARTLTLTLTLRPVCHRGLEPRTSNRVARTPDQQTGSQAGRLATHTREPRLGHLTLTLTLTLTLGQVWRIGIVTGNPRWQGLTLTPTLTLPLALTRTLTRTLTLTLDPEP